MTRASYRFLLASLLLLAGCATGNVAPEYALSQSNGKGVVVGSITSSGAYADYRLLYRKVGGGEEGYFQLKSSDPELNAALIVAELPAGDYEIYDWLINWPPNADALITQVSPPAHFSVPFHVKAGQAVYIGSCEFSFLLRYPWFYSYYYPNITRARVACVDRSERDAMEVKTRYPALGDMVAGLRAPQAELYQSAGFKAYLLNDN